jgi:dienelactone hydrolase
MNGSNCMTKPLLMPATLEYIASLFGGLVPHEAPVRVDLTHRLSTAQSLLENWCVQVGTERPISWTLWLEWPLANSHLRDCPILLSSDACWPHCLSSPARQAVLQTGVALASFNRLDIAHDSPSAQKSGPIYECWPGQSWGAISAWAWGISRCVDALAQICETTPRIGVLGHSRSGKAALLAGATDTRLALTAAHNSGTAGAASFKTMGPGAESLQALQETFPHWLGSECADATVQARIQAIDNAPLLAAIAPRALSILQASDDLWANPAGTAKAVEQLRKLYQSQGVPDRLQYVERTGGHAITPLDWQRVAEFLAALD